MEEKFDWLYRGLEQHRIRARVVPVKHVADLKQEIDGLHAQGAFDEDFCRERLGVFEFDAPSPAFTATSLIVAAVPRPQTRAVFRSWAKSFPLILPPTYMAYDKVSATIGDLIAKLLAPGGYRMALARLPLKSLAVRSGLAAYGRNNICYVPGMGSFLQLAAYYSDLPCENDYWRPPEMMEQCQDCQACLLKCPTQAITSERFLLHAERCIVFHNERSADHPFPEWMDLSSHDCLVGCMYCQRYCPEDKAFLDWFEGDEEFSREETSMLLSGLPRDRLPADMVLKLERLELMDYLAVLPRNLRVIFGIAESAD